MEVTTSVLTEEQWLQQLQSFLDNLLKAIIPNAQQRQLYFDPNAMKIWARAFTHETVSPSNNYEDDEFLGDAVLKYVFPKYLMKILPEFHKREFTELNTVYMSKMIQASLTQELGFTEYIRIRGIDRAILNVETDVFESFFGALDQVSDRITFGLGAANCYRMIEYIFSNRPIDKSKAGGAAKTQVIQIFSRFGLPRVATTSTDDINKHEIKFSVALTQEQIDFLKTYEVTIPTRDGVIGIGIAPTKKDAEFQAYSQALATLTAFGITTSWAEAAKHMRDFSDELVEPHVQPALEKLNKEGYETMYFFIPRKTVTPKGAIVELIGVRSDGEHVVLSHTYADVTDKTHRNAKALVVKQYIYNGKQ